MSAPRSKTQCASEPSSAASGVSSRRPVEEQVDADDRRGLERRRDGVATTTASASRSVRVVDAHAGLDRRTRLLECAAALRRRASSRAASSAGSRSELARGPEQRRPDGEEAGVRVHLVRREVERRPDEDVPEALDGRVRLAPRRRSSAPNVSPGSACALRQRASTSGMRSAVAQREVRVRRAAPPGSASRPRGGGARRRPAARAAGGGTTRPRRCAGGTRGTP